MTATDAVLSRLSGAGLRVGDATGAGLTVPYVVVYADQGQPTGDSRLSGDDDRETFFQVTAVGVSREQAEWAAAKANTGLVGHVMTVAGRVCGPITLYLSRPTVRDDDVQPPLFAAVAQYRFLSTTA